jgi:hypothetical protein
LREIKQLKKRFDFSTAPTNWGLVRVSIDWDGEPLLLFEEGRPSRPPIDAHRDALLGWMNSPPTAHVLVHWSEGKPNEVRFDSPTRLPIAMHVQPFTNGWLLAESRGGHARICDKDGKVLSTLDLGDAIKHVQTTPDGLTWVGYFDEGVFGGGIGNAGLVCFNPSGLVVFKYSDFAKNYDLPFIDDCYTLNVMGPSVLVSYYSEFPYVLMNKFKLENVWRNQAPNRAVAVRGNRFVIFPAYDKPYLTSRTFESDEESIWDLVDSEGTLLSRPAEGPPETSSRGWHVPFRCAARYGRMYVYNNIGLYELP